METSDKLAEFRRRFCQITKSDLLVDQASLREQLIRPLVPLFLSAFSNTPPNEINNKFGDGVNDFASLCATYLVREIDAKMAQPSRQLQAEQVSAALLPGGSCWPVFSSLRILASGSACIERFVKTGLASSFCRVLHLLYNFEFDQVDNEKVNIFVSSFGQLLSRILRSGAAAEDLVVRDDLKLLFVAAADSSYQIWRRVRIGDQAFIGG